MKKLCVALVLIVSNASAGWSLEGSNLEEEFWAIASQSGSLETLNTFLEAFPESVHAEEAKALAEGLSDDDRRREFEESIFGMVGQVTYDDPLKFGNDSIIGQSLANITSLTPLYSPVEGLPESYWRDQECSSCHQWTREDLCTQATTYIEKKPVKYQSKQHPFGGLLKINMRNWAIGGCE